VRRRKASFLCLAAFPEFSNQKDQKVFAFGVHQCYNKRVVKRKAKQWEATKMKFTAVFKTNKFGNVQHMVSDFYKTKGEFRKEMKSNGLIVLAIYKDTDIRAIKGMKSYELNTIERQYAFEILEDEK
jgi:hypothetical protein